jgi:serine/threonine-protein kinase 19
MLTKATADEKKPTSTQSLPSHYAKTLINLFTSKILIEQTKLSIQKSTLASQYKLTDRDFTYLIQFGLFTIRDASNFWLAIPNFGKFRRMLLETRKVILDCIRKKKYKEMEFDELDKRNSKGKVKQIGLVYVLHDLIGNEAISIMDVPNKSVCFKINNNV